MATTPDKVTVGGSRDARDVAWPCPLRSTTPGILGGAGMFVACYFLVGGGSFGARTVAISRQTASAAFEVTSGL
jgi:hypothetical protein